MGVLAPCSTHITGPGEGEDTQKKASFQTCFPAACKSESSHPSLGHPKPAASPSTSSHTLPVPQACQAGEQGCPHPGLGVVWAAGSLCCVFTWGEHKARSGLSERPQAGSRPGGLFPRLSSSAGSLLSSFQLNSQRPGVPIIAVSRRCLAGGLAPAPPASSQALHFPHPCPWRSPSAPASPTMPLLLSLRLTRTPRWSPPKPESQGTKRVFLWCSSWEPSRASPRLEAALGLCWGEGEKGGCSRLPSSLAWQGALGDGS